MELIHVTPLNQGIFAKWYNLEPLDPMEAQIKPLRPNRGHSRPLFLNMVSKPIEKHFYINSHSVILVKVRKVKELK